MRLAHALGLSVVAEGVEDAATSAALVAMGVDRLQGYHFTEPLPAEAVAVGRALDGDRAGPRTPVLVTGSAATSLPGWSTAGPRGPPRAG